MQCYLCDECVMSSFMRLDCIVLMQMNIDAASKVWECSVLDWCETEATAIYWTWTVSFTRENEYMVRFPNDSLRRVPYIGYTALYTRKRQQLCRCGSTRWSISFIDYIIISCLYNIILNTHRYLSVFSLHRPHGWIYVSIKYFER